MSFLELLAYDNSKLGNAESHHVRRLSIKIRQQLRVSSLLLQSLHEQTNESQYSTPTVSETPTQPTRCAALRVRSTIFPIAYSHQIDNPKDSNNTLFTGPAAKNDLSIDKMGSALNMTTR